MSRILDVQKLRLLDQPDEPEIDRVLECDILVAGGGVGGCAAALAACRAGRSVVLAEETDWLGGQMTSQGVSALDEHAHIEQFGGTATYYELRELIREFYREHTLLSPAGEDAEPLNPGNGWVSRLCFEPRAALWALDQLLQPFEADGRLVVLARHRAVCATVDGDRVEGVVFRHLDGPDHVEVRGTFVLDATELGDLLPLTGTEYVTGAEAAAETGEPHAREDGPAPRCSQSFTYPFVLEHRPGERHSVARPEGYELHRERQPYTLEHQYPEPVGWVRYRMFETAEKTPGSFWEYRRLIDAELFEEPTLRRDLAMINWPGNDYRHGQLIDVEPEEALRALEEARQLSLGFCYWLQNECPRDEGGAGYPELHLRPDVLDSEEGLAKYPYIRESRRIRALSTVVETDIAAEHQPGARARHFRDSGGIGFYGIDIHPAEGETKLPPAATRPFQIPISTLIPVRVENLLAAGKNLGVTHLTNGAYRLHPVEWNVGETAAYLAAFCIDRGLTPKSVVEDAHRLRRFQRRLVRSGVPLHWYVDVPRGHPAFEAAQVLAAWGLYTGRPGSLELDPDGLAGVEELAAFTCAPQWAQERLERFLSRWLPRWSQLDRASLLAAVYDLLNV
ncbi:MAG: FAD-dependent oxidoreductase [Armatimonadota bacterium]